MYRNYDITKHDITKQCKYGVQILMPRLQAAVLPLASKNRHKSTIPKVEPKAIALLPYDLLLLFPLSLMIAATTV